MEVILIENIEKLGKVGDIVKVKDGYARNYLIPKKKVLRASKENLKVFEEKKSIIENEEKKRKETAIETSSKIKDLEIIIELVAREVFLINGGLIILAAINCSRILIQISPSDFLKGEFI